MADDPADPAQDRRSRLARRWEILAAVGVLLLSAWSYVWTATSAGSPFSSRLQKDDLYNRLADGFLAGQLSFVEQPNPALANLADPWDPSQNAPYNTFHDVSYYHGKYYLYFGAAPALVLLVPWKAVTGTYLGENVAAAMFAWAAAAASIALVIVLRRRHFPGVKPWVAGICFIGVAFGNFALVLLRRPVFYELAIAAAYAFVMASLLCVALSQRPAPRRRLWLSLAGLFYGLTLASRPNYLFGSIILVVPFLPQWRLWRAGKTLDLREIRRDLQAVAFPFLAVAALLLTYNHHRFDSWTEFGQHYQLSGLNPQKDLVTTFAFLPTNFWFYFLAPAQLSAFFPFFEVIHLPWFHLPAGYTGEEDVYGICNMPFYWFAALLIVYRRDQRITGAVQMADFAAGVLALAAANFLVLSRIGGASNRYIVDLFPALLPLACVGVFCLEQSGTEVIIRAGVRALWIGAVAYTALFNAFVSLHHNDLYEYYHPAEYRELAHAFNHVSSWLGETRPSRLGPLRIKLRFPTGKTGHLEPLVVSGLSFKADFIYLYYTDNTHLQIGFEHTSFGGAVTKPPIAINYSEEHSPDIYAGSLYPPQAHPYFDRMRSDQVERVKKTLRVVLDGKDVLSGTYNFYDSSAGDVSVGYNPVSDAFGRRFTGQVLSIERLPAAE